MKTNHTFGIATKAELKEYCIINMIAFKADAVSTGNFQSRKDEKSCSLETFNNPNYYKHYKN